MMNAVRQRAESYNEWASRVTEVMEAKLDKKRSEFHSEHFQNQHLSELEATFTMCSFFIIINNYNVNILFINTQCINLINTP